MRISAGVALATGVALWAAMAAADTYYKYRDKRTGRDVYVNQLEQVPQKYRSQAKIVLEAPGTAADPSQETATQTTGPAAAATTPASGPSPKPSFGLRDDFRRATSNKSLLRDGPAIAAMLVDLKLAASGTRPLTGSERNHLASLLGTIAIAAAVAGLAALAAWIAILVTAIRDERLWWAFFVFLFWPVAYLYLFIHGGKDRTLWKAVCALALLAPTLVAAVGAWRGYAWLLAVFQARGLPS